MANTWTVGTSGEDFSTIQDAIAASNSGDTIQVSAGTYAGFTASVSGVSIVAVGAARQSITRLSEALMRAAPKREVTALPRPARSLDVEHLVVLPPGGRKPIVANAHFSL